MLVRESLILILVGVSTAVIIGCSEHQFTCTDGTCILLEWECDGSPECDDESDELDCDSGNVTCSAEEWQCRNGICILGEFRCDTTFDCSDQSDEQDCSYPCGPNQFQCLDGTCIKHSWSCDGEFDCEDHSDEINCNKTVSEEDDCQGFLCDNNRCVVESLVCDTNNDCGDNSDEKRCSVGMCTQHEFRCTDGSCIDLSYKCDGIMDCVDMADEAGCQGAVCDPRTQFTCIDGTCIRQEESCDGVAHCPDSSDEIGCGNERNCTASQFQCGRSGECINKDWICDFMSDCEDGSDELGCDPVQCDSVTEFQCDARNCIPLANRCDSVKDCHNGVDELHCGNCNGTTEFECDNKKCVTITSHCDRQDDCGDSSDELDCYTRACDSDEYKCDNGQCISLSFVCDGEPDCFGYDDEDTALCTDMKCDQWKCGSGECIDESWVCDAHFDCNDRSDEHDCPEPCEGFVCQLTKECIPGDKECDGGMDCADGTDEIHCSVNECGMGISGCSHLCIDQIEGYLCLCPPGFKLSPDNHTCTDIDECSLIPEACEHYCVNNKGGYRCECALGYVAEDRALCRAHGAADTIEIYVSTNEGLVVLGSTPRQLISDPDYKISLFRVDGSLIVFYDLKSRSIRTFNRTDNRTRILYKGVSVDGLVLDTLQSAIYWSDTSVKGIRKGNYDGSEPAQLGVSAEYTPHALAISSKFRKLYWAVKGHGIRETSLKTLTTTELTPNSTENHYISSITVDEVLDRVYWSVKRYGKIFYLDRHFRKHVIERNVTFPQVIGTADHYIFYQNELMNEIVRYDRLTSATSPVYFSHIPINYFQVVTSQRQLQDTPPHPQSCKYNQLACDGSCIDMALVCDGLKHCPSGRDEVNCTTGLTSSCSEDMFTCADSSCIPKSWVCDGNNDCVDYSDETFSACHDTPCTTDLHFRCSSGRCVSKLWRCDGQFDCSDRSDELNCTAVAECSEQNFRCRDGSGCITSDLLCDDKRHCQDGSDEEDCEKEQFCETADLVFKCDDTCIPDTWVCDGVVDCTDKTDERECFQCAKDQVWDKEKRRCTFPEPCHPFNCQQRCHEGLCSCIEGYILTEEGRCLPITTASSMILLSSSAPPKIQNLGGKGDGKGGDVLGPVKKLRGVTLMDYHLSLQKLVYADDTSHSIVMTSLSASARRSSTLQEIHHYGDHSVVGDIAVDWVSDNVYWTNKTSHGIMVSNIDGTAVVEITKLDTVPWALTVDPIRGYLYWIGKVGGRADIYSCKRNGLGVRAVHYGQFHPTSLTVDTVTGRVFWHDAQFRAIFSNQGVEEDSFITVAKNIREAAHLKYNEGSLYWTSQSAGPPVLVTYDLTRGRVTHSSRLDSTPDRLLVYQDHAQQVTDKGSLTCRNNRGGCSDLCFARSTAHSRQECGCVGGEGDMAICLSEEPRCLETWCGLHGWCDVGPESGEESCRCGHGYHGDHCDWVVCTEECMNNTSCYENTSTNSKYCCHQTARGCTGTPNTVLLEPLGGFHPNYDITTMLTVGLSVTVTIGVLLAALGYKKWRKRRGRARSNTLVDMYQMEQVREEDTRLEDDEPLLFD